MKFSDVEQYTRSSSYRVNMEWNYAYEWLDKWTERVDDLPQLQLNPDFQRGHVWTKQQQIAYVEHILRGGATTAVTNVIRFNCVGWSTSYKGPFVLVDGKQRLQAVRMFLDDKIKAFGHKFSEFEGHLPSHCEFIFAVNNLPTRADVLKWYLEINTGGVVHSSEEIKRVKALYKKELTGLE